MNNHIRSCFGALVASCVVLLYSSSAMGQTVVTNPVSTTTYCPSDSISVSFSATGSFGDKNAFSLQLSGPDGSFGGSFLNLRSIRGTTSGTIAGAIPENIAGGTHYRVRVISSTPYVTGTDNGADLSIGAKPSANFRSSTTLAMVGDTVTFSALGADSGALGWNWDFGADATPATSTSQSVAVVYSTGGSKTVSLVVTGQFGCTSTSVMRTDPGLALAMKHTGLTIIDCNPQIPREAGIDSTEDPSGPRGVTWVVPGATFSTGGGGGLVVFAEPGAKVINGGGGSSTFYLKDGSSLELNGGGSHVIVAGSNAGITLGGGATVYRCSDLSFDYSVAPPYKFPVGQVAGNANSAISMYPNPVQTMLFVQLARSPIGIRIRDERGAELLSASGNFTSLLQIDVRAFAAGTYYLELQYPDDRSVERFVVSR